VRFRLLQGRLRNEAEIDCAAPSMEAFRAAESATRSTASTAWEAALDRAAIPRSHNLRAWPKGAAQASIARRRQVQLSQKRLEPSCRTFLQCANLCWRRFGGAHLRLLRAAGASPFHPGLGMPRIVPPTTGHIWTRRSIQTRRSIWKRRWNSHVLRGWRRRISSALLAGLDVRDFDFLGLKLRGVLIDWRRQTISLIPGHDWPDDSGRR
jgi:hypothetical protein